jgi:ATP-dependent DNA helicase PIF1
MIEPEGIEIPNEVILYASQFMSNELVFDVTNETQQYTLFRDRLNEEQILIHNRVLDALDNNLECFIFIPGPGGCGKTFLMTTICHLVRSRSLVILPTAWTGIAASLMIGGQTCHTRFCLPVPYYRESTSSIKPDSQQARFILLASVIILDEASMIPSYFLNELDRLLKDITKSTLPFGGKIILVTGDLRQTLPIIPRATKAELIANSITHSSLWHLFEVMQLSINMRVNHNERQFAQWLELVGNGQLPRYESLPLDSLRLPNSLLLPNVIDNNIIRPSNEYDLIGFVFGEPFDTDINSKRAILTPLNLDALSLNQKIIELVEGFFLNF